MQECFKCTEQERTNFTNKTLGASIIASVLCLLFKIFHNNKIIIIEHEGNLYVLY